MQETYISGRYTADMSDMVGRVFTEVQATDDSIRFVCDEGEFHLYHEQECCENVRIESITGDLSDLIGEPLLLADEANGETPVGCSSEYEPESYTWTFYTFATRKGYVDVRFLGESNGYYSESVSLYFFKK